MSTPRHLLRSLGPLPETSVRTPPNFREVPPEAVPVRKLVGKLSYLPLEFWCSEGHFAQFDLILTLFWPILTCFDLFRRADLTYFHTYSDLFAGRTWPIFTYFDLFRFTIRLHGRDTSGRKSPLIKEEHLTRSSKWHYRQRNNSFEWIMHFIADTDTEESDLEINFS